MFRNDVNNGGDSSAQPGWQAVSFEDQAQAILDSFNPSNDGGKSESNEPPAGNPEEKKEETPPKEDPKDPPKEEKKPEAPKEENKVPLSRLNKVIDQRDTIAKELEFYKKKDEELQKSFESLSDEEKEERMAYKKLWLETKDEKYKETIEKLQMQIDSLNGEIEKFENEKKQSEVTQLQNRIEELTNLHNGENGLPKFDIQELIEFWKEENYMPKDPLKLYELKYKAEIFASKYKASEKTPEIDKWNNQPFAPMKPKIVWFDSKEFEEEALKIIEATK